MRVSADIILSLFSRNQVHKDIDVDTTASGQKNIPENIAYECNTSYDLVAGEKEERATEKFMYEAIEDLSSKNTAN